MSGDTSYSSHPHSRVVHIVRGDGTDEEVAAALTVVLAGLARTRSAGTAAAGPTVAQSAWGDPVRRLRVPLQCGPGAWRASAFPR